MDLKRKISDFIRLEQAQGNAPKLTSLGVAVVSSVLVSTLLDPAQAEARPHCDCYDDYADRIFF